MLARAFDESHSPYIRPVMPGASSGVPTAEPDTAALDAEVFPHHPDAIPPGIVSAGSYELRFAWNRQDLHAVQTLRHRVFHGGTDAAVESTSDAARDADAHDPWFHHLMVTHRATGQVVGTYRLQTAVMAATRHGFYSASLFELGAIPGHILGEAVEVGRACVDPAHRSGRVLHLLWRGLARYLRWNSKRYLFGCCSITGIDDRVAVDSWKALHARAALHDRVLVRPRAFARALPDDGRARPLIDAAALVTPLPPLFEGYLSLGARVCGAPAVDRTFGTTDYLVLLDVQAMAPKAHQTFFG